MAIAAIELPDLTVISGSEDDRHSDLIERNPQISEDAWLSAKYGYLDSQGEFVGR